MARAAHRPDDSVKPPPVNKGAEREWAAFVNRVRERLWRSKPHEREEVRRYMRDRYGTEI